VATDNPTLRGYISGAVADQLAANGPLTTKGDVLRRWRRVDATQNGNILHPAGFTAETAAQPIRNTFAAENLARSVSNLVTVRTDQYLVIGRVQVHTGGTAAPTEIFSERLFCAVLDRSYDPVRVLMFKWLEQ
jgi:hypothetical protein